MKRTRPLFIVYAKRVTGQSGQTPLGFVVAMFGPYPSLATATAAIPRIQANHGRLTAPEYYLGTMQLHPKE